MSERLYNTKEKVLARGLEAIGIPLKDIDSTNRLKTGKGAIGNIIEESWFGYKINNESEPDFKEAGVELKVTPYIRNSKGIRAKERLVCNIIDYMEEYQKIFETSSFYHKCRTILLMSYEHIEGVSKGDFTIDKVVLFGFPEEDLIIIKQDWQKIIEKVRKGKAHEISEGDTLYLGACTKGTTAKTERNQPFSLVKAKQRAYSLKQSYMTYILNTYVFGNRNNEHIFKDPIELKNIGFEKYITNRIKPFIGKSQEELNAATREKLRIQLKQGNLDKRMIELDLSSDSMPMLQVLGPIGLEEMGINLNDMFGNMMPKKSKKRKLSIAEARKVLAQDEANKLIDMDAVIKEAVEKVQNSGIVFIDEIDKVAGGSSKSSQGGGPDVSREGVQRDLLPIVEGSTVVTKYGPVKTDHILFIASGAFHISKPSDLIPELQGRFPIRVELNSLDEKDFYKILTQPENALIKQYKALLKSENIELNFTDDSIKEIAKIAAEVNEQVENIGARRLHTILTTVLDEILFDVPDKIKKNKIDIDKKYVNEKLNAIVKNRDLSRYIL